MQLPRNVSPVSASFFGLQRLGIHLVLCVACSLLALLLPVAAARVLILVACRRSWCSLLADHTLQRDLSMCVSSASLLLSAKLK
jgi:hypothetical protein